MAKKELPEAAVVEDSLVVAALKYAAGRGDEDAKTKLDSIEASQQQTQEVARIKDEMSRKEGVGIEDANTLTRQVALDPGYFDGYSKLIKLLKKEQGNEAKVKIVYSLLLSEYPLCYGYWIRLATECADCLQAARQVTCTCNLS
eukprot:GHVQ01000804.1.p1 GENE.GHVQ01000804.1~~GHVQ01000804.1.p1  ORF type:complete len:144 (+),score=25.62 GHVQ01000804.1:245-676(+)